MCDVYVCSCVCASFAFVCAYDTTRLSGTFFLTPRVPTPRPAALPLRACTYDPVVVSDPRNSICFSPRRGNIRVHLYILFMYVYTYSVLRRARQLDVEIVVTIINNDKTIVKTKKRLLPTRDYFS